MKIKSFFKFAGFIGIKVGWVISALFISMQMVENFFDFYSLYDVLKDNIYLDSTAAILAQSLFSVVSLFLLAMFCFVHACKSNIFGEKKC